MRIDILTLFPEMFSPLDTSIIARARNKGIVDVQMHNIRDYSTDKHHKTDDYSFGGGAGMVMTPQPAIDAIESVSKLDERQPLCIYLSPRGKTLTTEMAMELAQEERLLLFCGHYEGIDERILQRIDRQISIGDYVLTGGELPAMVIIDSVSRFLPGVLGSEESAFDESFSQGLLEYPQYTRPADFRGEIVPDVLIGGHHAKITAWRRAQALLITARERPDLLVQAQLTNEDVKVLHDAQYHLEDDGTWCYGTEIDATE